jgi:hypothetical protein
VVGAHDGRCRPGHLFDGLCGRWIGPQYRADRPSWSATGWSPFDLMGASQHGMPPLSVQALKRRTPGRSQGRLGGHRFHLGYSTGSGGLEARPRHDPRQSSGTSPNKLFRPPAGG